MDGPSLQVGDRIPVTVTRSLPFGVLVETPTGIPGLIRGVVAAVGDVLDVRVDDVDGARNRFAGSAG